MKNGDMPAMPVVIPVGVVTQPESGLTKRKAFAKAAMQGLCTIRGYGDIEDITHDAVLYVDALLAELERTKSS